MSRCFFVSDIHGRADSYQKLFRTIEGEQPDAVFLGGDLGPMAWAAGPPLRPGAGNFISGYLVPHLVCLRNELGRLYPRIFVILGNDDCRYEEASILSAAASGLWEYIAGRRVEFGSHPLYGYPFVPPTPFLLKDWERYDVSRYVDPGCVSPEEGVRSVPVSEREKKYATMVEDLERLAAGRDLSQAIFLFHAPPYGTKLDVTFGGRMFEHVPLDIHLGSIAVRRFIESHQPFLTLHGHVHEAAAISGSWRDRIGRTHCFTAAHDGPELALVEFDLQKIDEAVRRII
ncbi:MAG: metallophosphoesterase [Candidatus Aminicenantes bacterium]|nr:metallophosphoesterase [Candidatus Aminicenantes bacterium]